MKGSSFYQAILAEGRAQGRAEWEAEEKVEFAKDFLMRAALRRLGPPGPAACRSFDEVEEYEAVMRLFDRFFQVASWEKLLAPEAGSSIDPDRIDS